MLRCLWLLAQMATFSSLQIIFQGLLKLTPTYNKAAKTAAEKLYNDFILPFGIPASILHDQDRGFENGLHRHLSVCLKLCSIQRLRTSPYHPQGNGQCERM